MSQPYMCSRALHGHTGGFLPEYPSPPRLGAQKGEPACSRVPPRGRHQLREAQHSAGAAAQKLQQGSRECLLAPLALPCDQQPAGPVRLSWPCRPGRLWPTAVSRTCCMHLNVLMVCAHPKHAYCIMSRVLIACRRAAFLASCPWGECR